MYIPMYIMYMSLFLCVCIQCQPSRLEFGTVTIGTSHTHTITLINPSLCALHYSLNVVLHTSASGEETNSSLHGYNVHIE